MANGTLTREGDHWVAHPGKIGTDAVITVTASIDGRQQTVNTTSFRVRKLPDPVAFISLPGSNGSTERYKGGKPIAKASLLNAKGLDAAIDDDILNIDFRVKSFEMVFIDSNGDAAVQSFGRIAVLAAAEGSHPLNDAQRPVLHLTNQGDGPCGIDARLILWRS